MPDVLTAAFLKMFLIDRGAGYIEVGGGLVAEGNCPSAHVGGSGGILPREICEI